MSDEGYFYVIQLSPDVAPNRLKLGWTRKPDQRLRAHRTVAPTAQLLELWPCHKTWEAAAIAEIATGAKVGPEVFDCDDVERVIEQAAGFFAARDCQSVTERDVIMTHSTLSLRLDSALKAALQEMANRESRTLSNMILYLLHRAVSEPRPAPTFSP